MKNLLILLSIGTAVFFYFRSKPAPPAETPASIPTTATPKKVSETPRPVTITELLQPLYGNIFGQDKDSDLIVDSASEVLAVFSLVQTLPVSHDPVITHIIASSRRLCGLMQQAITDTNQARDRLEANKTGHRTANTRFFDAGIEQRWRAGLAQVRSQAAIEWTRLQQTEHSLSVPVLIGDPQSRAQSIITARRDLQSARQREAANRAARKAAEPSPPVSSMRRIGGG